MRAAVMGMRHGHISEFVRAAEENPAVTLVGIAEDEPAVRARVEAEHSVPVYADFIEMLEKERPQVVGVARTNATKYWRSPPAWNAAFMPSPISRCSRRWSSLSRCRRPMPWARRGLG